jgi:dienelactone hydrolase
MKSPLLTAVALGLSAVPVGGQTTDIGRGVVVPSVQCADTPDQTYALYLPSNYSPDRPWTVLLAFHPAADGRRMVETFRAGAEALGVIVAASNNARNGPHEISARAAQAMGIDVSRRFAVDEKRVYLAGMSGGARVALGLALANPAVAGVIASSAGFPDSQPRAEVPFAIFGTAGLEDFNHVEMRLLDRALRSPHFLAVFDGGHTLPPERVAVDALEWMEVQAMRSGRRGKDLDLARRIFEGRKARVDSTTDPAEAVYQLDALVRDFKDLLDVSAEAHQFDAMSQRPEVRRAVSDARDRDDEEARTVGEILALEAELGDPDRRVRAMMALRARFSTLARKASDGTSPDARTARRVLRSLSAASRAGTPDREYLALLEAHQPPRR